MYLEYLIIHIYGAENMQLRRLTLTLNISEFCDDLYRAGKWSSVAALQ